MTPPPKELPQGLLIKERYRITGQLGKGGFATVYSAHDESEDRQVAIKVLDSIGDRARERAKYLERFRREASIAVALDHPHIAQVYAYGTLPEPINKPYMVMELLEGYDLEDELRFYGPLDPERVLRLMLWALDALGTAHRRGIVHKDLKPSNMFLLSPRDPQHESLKLLDFGVARLHSDLGSKLTTQGRFIGTPQYLAPEYIEHQIVSPAVDVYQMGLIMVELITGTPVVEGAVAVECLTKHLKGDLPLPQAIEDSSLGPIIRRAIARDPKERYADAFELRDILMGVDISDLHITAEAPQAEDPALAATSHVSLSAPEEGPANASPQPGAASRQPDPNQTEPVAQTPPQPPSGGSSWVKPLLIAVVITIVVAALGFGALALLSTEDPPTKKKKKKKKRGKKPKAALVIEHSRQA